VSYRDGYREIEGGGEVIRAVSAQVAEGRDAGSLDPLLFIAFRVERGAAEAVTVGVSPELADLLADELRRWAERSRDKRRGLTN
jgi:hypothetical protein